jgi:hypothetical protein
MLQLAIPSMVVALVGGVGWARENQASNRCGTVRRTLDSDFKKKGIVSAENKSVNGKPIPVEFQAPWPLLPTAAGLEARDLLPSEAAFVQVVSAASNWDSPKVFKQLLIDSVLASQGKFGAYGTPVDIKVKPLSREQYDFQ